VFERFTEQARQAVVQGQAEARSFKHGYIGTEHILLGLLLVEEGLAAEVLTSLEVTREEVRQRVSAIVGEGDVVPAGQIPFAPRAKKVLELALREALSFGHNYIGTEHILLGLVRENEGVAVRILLDLGVDGERMRDEVVRAMPVAARKAAMRPRGARGFRRPPAMVGAQAGCWEYRLERRDALDQQWLNELGEQWWELVDVRPVDDALELIFKRRKPIPGSLRTAG